MILSPLKPALLWLLLLWQTAPQPVNPSIRFRYQREVRFAPAPGRTAEAAQVCAVLDADVFAHAAPSLRDLRLYSGDTEIPYATTLSEPLQQESEDARIVNLRQSSGHLLFDLEMPRRPYTGLVLDLAAHDYIARAAVSGSAAASGGKVTQLGTFTLFDLASQHLSRSTDIPLSESTFPYLHIDLTLNPAPGNPSSSASLNAASTVKAATVPPSREAQSLYTTTQRSTSLLQEGQASVATFQIEARVPVERIAFALPPGYKGSFSRAVNIEARGIPGAASQDQAAFGPEDVTGSIFRVHKFESGHELAAESLGIPVAIGSNMQQPAVVRVIVENGPGPPVPITTVALQMRQRRICFDAAAANGPLTVYYGDPSLDAPAYHDAKLLQASATPRMAQLDAERVNVDVASASPARRSARPRPVMRWVALLGVVCIFALLVIRSTRKRMAHR